MHLVSWEQVCLPVRHGGLGIRSYQLMNSSFMAKLG